MANGADVGEWVGNWFPLKERVLTWVGVARSEVEAFHALAVAAGGTCHGKPGIRAHSGPTYFAAFVRDPVGNNIEAVCTAAE